MSTLTKNYCGFYQFFLFGLILLALGWSAPSYAIYSCDAAAGFIAGAGSGDSCGLNKYGAHVSYNVGESGIYIEGAAHTVLAKGAMNGHISLDGTGDAQFYSNMLVDFTINGPASSAQLPVNLIFSFAGSIATNCSNCDADLNFSSQLQAAGLNLRAASGRIMHNGVISDWNTSLTTQGLNSTGSIVLFDPDTNMGSITFDASTILGQNLRFTGALGANVHLNALGVINITADHSNLFNILLPDGYTLSAGNTNFLSDPTLIALPEVPLPTTAVLFISGLMTFAGTAFARRRC